MLVQLLCGGMFTDFRVDVLIVSGRHLLASRDDSAARNTSLQKTESNDNLSGSSTGLKDSPEALTHIETGVNIGDILSQQDLKLRHHNSARMSRSQRHTHHKKSAVGQEPTLSTDEILYIIDYFINSRTNDDPYHKRFRPLPHGV